MHNQAAYLTKYIAAQLKNGIKKDVIDAELASYLSKLGCGNKH
ncbi:hypothetical protein [Vibrio genomosp. F10]|nr:hypothetical protein [Vibrio genomosp. F10]